MNPAQGIRINSAPSVYHVNSGEEQERMLASYLLSLLKSSTLCLTGREANHDRPEKKIEILYSDVEIYTQESFQELLIYQVARFLPCFLIQINGTSSTAVFDGTSFLRALYVDPKLQHPLTREQLKTFKVYKSRQKKPREFKFICDSQTFPGKNQHWMKFINACSTDLPALELGQAQFYMSEYYQRLATEKPEKEISRLRKSKFWLDLAAKKNYPMAHLKLATWYCNGNAITPVNGKKVQKHFKAHLHSIEPKDSKILAMCATYRELLAGLREEINKEINKELDFCRSTESTYASLKRGENNT